MCPPNEEAAAPAAATVAGAPADAAERRVLPVWLAVAGIVFAAMCFGGSIVAGRAAAGNVPPLSLSFIRWAVAFLVVVALARQSFWQTRRIVAAHLPLMTAFAVLGVVLFTVPYYIGLHYTEAVNATLLNASGPIMTLFLARFVLGTPITALQGIGIVAAVAGVTVIVARGDPAALATLSLNPGDGLLMISFLSWAVYTVLLRWRPEGIPDLAFLSWIFLIASLIMLPLWLWDLAAGRTFAASLDNLVIIGYAAVFPSALAYICWNKAVESVGPGMTSLTQYLIPAFGVILSVLILGERLRAFHVPGIALILGGIYLSSRRRAEPVR